ncbi:hypothetical protein JYG23_08820 [Sedimentibacter sp. zth1]|nr:hypothetical protein [Sedimentibacter sp. zth1]QSX04808.1 hypothetical protein JYG23_08820 [Sedimentibacter sp. zth1]
MNACSTEELLKNREIYNFKTKENKKSGYYVIYNGFDKKLQKVVDNG